MPFCIMGSCLRMVLALCLCQSSKDSFILACGTSHRTMPSARTKDQHPQSSSAQSTLDEVIRNAYKNINVDKITLVFPSSETAITDNTGSVAANPVIKRPSLGQTVSFVCETSSENSSNMLIWTHQGKIVVQNGHLLPMNNITKHQYNFLLHGQGTILSIINVSFASSGAVICYERLNTTTTILKRYSLHPNVSRAVDVFTVPMPNWSIEAATTRMQKIWCKVHLPLPSKIVAKGEARDLFIWRHNNRTVVAPRKHPYELDLLSTSRRGSFTLSGHVYNHTASTICFWMMLDAVDSNDSGSVECWFRAMPDIHEWYIQSANVDVYRRAPEAPDELED